MKLAEPLLLVETSNIVDYLAAGNHRWHCDRDFQSDERLENPSFT
jgi:hypothetical protein